MNICPVCRNVNQRDATICRFCGTTLTPPPVDVPVAVAPPRRRRWPWITGATALLLVAGLGGLSLFGGGAAAGGPQTITVGTDPGATLQFVPTSVPAPANTPINLIFNNVATVVHNLKFEPTSPITAGTADAVPAKQSQTLQFTTPGPGSYKFVCTLHPGMEGQLVVQ